MSKTNNSLGKGLDALFGATPTNIDSMRFFNEEIVQLSISDIIPNPDQPRHHFDEKSLQEMALSIKEFGILQPLVVTKNEQNKYSIIAGERRWRASRIAGLTKVPVIIRSATELEKLELALIENVQREDLTPLDQAVSVLRLHDQFSMSYEAIAAKLGKAYSTVANIVRLLQLPEVMQSALHEKKISEGHARSLLSLQSEPEKQLALFALILKSHLSVRQAEQYVVASREAGATKTKAVQRVSSETAQTKQLSKHLGVKVNVQYLAKGGRLNLRFSNEQELNTILKRLMQA